MPRRARTPKLKASTKPFNDIDAGILALARVHSDLSAGATLSTGYQTFDVLKERWAAHGWVIMADYSDWAWPADGIVDDLVRQLGTPEHWPPPVKQAKTRAQCTTVRLVNARPERCPSRTLWRAPSGEARCAWCWGEEAAD